MQVARGALAAAARRAFTTAEAEEEVELFAAPLMQLLHPWMSVCVH